MFSFLRKKKGIVWDEAVSPNCETYLPASVGEVIKIMRVVDSKTVHVALWRQNHFVKLACRIRGIDILEAAQNEIVAKSILANACEGKLATIIYIGMDKYGKLLVDLMVKNSTKSLSQMMLNHVDIYYEILHKNEEW